jgi:hypothetical protein
MDDVSSGLTIPAIAATSRPSDMLAAVQVWEQVLSVPESEPEAADDWREAARVCARIRTDWEMNYCQSLIRFVRISPKQETLLRICIEKMQLAKVAP